MTAVSHFCDLSDWVKINNPKAPAVKRETEEDCTRFRPAWSAEERPAYFVVRDHWRAGIH